MNRPPSVLARCLLAMATLAPSPAFASMKLAVATHFNQGWPIKLLDQVKIIGAPAIRDELTWTTAEKIPGRYDFTKGSHLAAACRAGREVLIVMNPRNPLYDGGRFVTSQEGQRAFAAYVAALAAKYHCITALEVGNEINGAKWFSGPDPRSLAESYVALLRELRNALPKQGRPKLLGGSTNLIGTGFLKPFFAAGMLDVVDGVVVHPYRPKAEGLDRELEGLKVVMRQYGSARPIWATEFSDTYDTPNTAANQLIKEVAMMSAAGVDQAYWYALIEEPWFKNMGLFDGTVPRPAALAFKQAEGLLKAGDAVRVNPGDTSAYVYRFGANSYVMWGAARAVSFDGGAQVRNARGQPVISPIALGDEPIVATNVRHYEFGGANFAADSLYQFGERPWSYFVADEGGKLRPTVWTDWNWGSHFSAPGFKAFTVGAESITFLGNARAGIVERYTAPRAQTLFVNACFARKPAPGNVRIEIEAAGKTLFSGNLDTLLKPPLIKVDFLAGEPLDITYRSFGAGPFGARRRIQLSPTAQAKTLCP